jgi:hypothetical protein
MTARLIQVIEVDERRGKGIEGDPVRVVLQYWSTDGVLLAERDTWLWSLANETHPSSPPPPETL